MIDGEDGLMKTLAEQIAVMQAALDGAEIESIGIGFQCSRDRWVTGPGTEFNWSDCDYRVKPKPLVRYVVRYSDGTFGTTAHKTLELAIRACTGAGSRTVKMQEVPE